MYAQKPRARVLKPFDSIPETRFANVMKVCGVGGSVLHKLSCEGFVRSGVFKSLGASLLIKTFTNILANTPSIKFVIYDGEPSDTLVSGINAVRESIKVVSLDELRALGKSQLIEPLKAHLPKPETTTCIMYSSGSTDPLKSVSITHANLVASVGAVYMLLGHHLTYDGTYLAYLPLAHVLDYIVELIILFVGMMSGYGHVNALGEMLVSGMNMGLWGEEPREAS
ncbi:hypothetical protein F5890DRAFT_1627886 [Lentinula detonsa]|uniref:AMP-dependent synthetase/ligase domain-containing protein n=1 Tax=Lentinula detonsa TaxID=2804962 RepID=A0AA38PR35_9AGAR|nr:hypothetical protein F5890DRAFT_1627886 [Lentinula detonsa]